LTARSGVSGTTPVFVGSSEFFGCRTHVSCNVSFDFAVQSGSIGDAEGFVEVRKIFLFSKTLSDFRMCDVLVSCVGLEF